MLYWDRLMSGRHVNAQDHLTEKVITKLDANLGPGFIDYKSEYHFRNPDYQRVIL